MKRKATALWQGDLKSGKGRMEVGSGALKETPYSFRRVSKTSREPIPRS